MLQIKRKIVFLTFTLFISIFMITSSIKISTTSKVKYVDIYNFVREMFLTDKGYTEDTAKHISQTAFERINIYHVYNVNNPKYKKPFKINFYLKEDSQRKNGNIIHVNMIYSVEIKDANNRTVGGSLHVPMVLQVEKADDWYIVTEHEEI